MRTRASPSKLDPYAAELTARLVINRQLPRKQRRTAKQLHAALVAKGYPGSYGRVAAFARKWPFDLELQQPGQQPLRIGRIDRAPCVHTVLLVARTPWPDGGAPTIQGFGSA